MGTIMQIKSFVSYSILFSVFVIAIGVLGKGAAILMAANPQPGS
jgi:hypothetical protein